jgi:hypothetical protein
VAIFPLEGVSLVSVAGGGGGGGGIFTSPRLGTVRVASNALPADVKAQCDFVCDGVDDQVQINAALALATRPGDGFGGEGYGTVRLVGPSFSIADDNATAILGHPNTILEGGGAGTLVSPKWTSTTVDRGCIELVTQGTTRFKVYNLTIGHAAADSSKFNGHGIKFQGNGTGGTYELPTGADAYLQVQDVNIHYPRGHGVYTLGTAGDPSGCRGFRAKSVSVQGAYIAEQCRPTLIQQPALSGGFFDRTQSKRQRRHRQTLRLCCCSFGSRGYKKRQCGS